MRSGAAGTSRARRLPVPWRGSGLPDAHLVDPTPAAASRRGVSTDTEVSRCAIAASRTWAFDNANFLPPLRPRARAALSPATVRSRISSRSNSASVAKMPNTRQRRSGGVDLRALAGEHTQAHAAGRQVLHGVDQVGEGCGRGGRDVDAAIVPRCAGCPPRPASPRETRRRRSPRSRTDRDRGRERASDVQASCQAATVQASCQAATAVPARSHLSFGDAGMYPDGDATGPGPRVHTVPSSTPPDS